MARKIEVEIVGDSRSLERAFGRASSSAKKFNLSIGSIVKSAAVFGVIAGAATLMGKAISTAVGEWKEQVAVAAQTNAVLKSTAGVANVTARAVGKLAGDISALTGIDDEAIQAGENLILTFKNVRNELGKGNNIFDRATKAAVDLSVAGFGSINTTSKQLGKALNDPIKGMTALSRAGVTFTAGQAKTIKGLVESGKLLEAQKLLLREVESQVGGSAKAFGRTLPGQLARLREAFKNSLGGLVQLVARPLSTALGHVNRFVGRFQKAQGVRAKFNVAIEGLSDLGQRIFAMVTDAIRSIDWAEAVATAQAGLVAGLRRVAEALDRINWGEVGRRLGQAIAAGMKGAAEFLRSVDWSFVGERIVQGVSKFLKSVDWKAVAVNLFRLLQAAVRGVVQLVIGIGRELGRELMAGIGKGVDAGVDFILQKLLQFVNKVLGVTGFLGRFDPFKGVRAKVQRQLEAMEADTRSSVGAISQELAKIKDVDVKIRITTITDDDGKQRPVFGIQDIDSATRAAKAQATRENRAITTAAKARQAAAAKAAATAQAAATAGKAAAQKAAAVAKKAGEQRDKAFASLMDSLELKLDRAQESGGFKGALSALAEQERAVRAQIASAGKSVELERELFRIETERKGVREQMRQLLKEQSEKASERRQSRQFKAIGLSATGEERVPGVENLRKQFASLSTRVAESPGEVSSKLTNRLAGVKRALAGAFGELEAPVREAIRDLFAAIRGEFDEQSGKLGPDLRRVQISDKIAQALGFSKTDLLKGMPSSPPPSARAPVASAPVAGGGTTINVNGNIVTDNPDDFLKQMQRRASRTTGSTRGRFPGQSLGLS